jgi:hypothetical protein
MPTPNQFESRDAFYSTAFRELAHWRGHTSTRQAVAGFSLALAQSATALDIYCWLAQRLHRIPLAKPQLVPWSALYDQFGHGYREIRKFRRDFLKLLTQVKAAYPDAKLTEDHRGIMLAASPPPVSKRVIQVCPLSNGN